MPSFVYLFRRDHTELVYKGGHLNDRYHHFSCQHRPSTNQKRGCFFDPAHPPPAAQDATRDARRRATTTMDYTNTTAPAGAALASSFTAGWRWIPLIKGSPESPFPRLQVRGERFAWRTLAAEKMAVQKSSSFRCRRTDAV